MRKTERAESPGTKANTLWGGGTREGANGARRRATAVVAALVVMLTFGATSAAAKGPRHKQLSANDVPVTAVATDDSASATVSYSDSLASATVSYDP